MLQPRNSTGSGINEDKNKDEDEDESQMSSILSQLSADSSPFSSRASSPTTSPRGFLRDPSSVPTPVPMQSQDWVKQYILSGQCSTCSSACWITSAFTSTDIAQLPITPENQKTVEQFHNLSAELQARHLQSNIPFASMPWLHLTP